MTCSFAVETTNTCRLGNREALCQDDCLMMFQVDHETHFRSVVEDQDEYDSATNSLAGGPVAFAK